MDLRSLFLVASISTFGCAASSNADDTEASAAGTEDALSGTAADQAAIKPVLDALRVRVAEDFPTLDAKKFKLVFVLKNRDQANVRNTYATDGKSAFVKAWVKKVDRATGAESELTEDEKKASVYAEDIQDGAFDGPHLVAILKKANGVWAIASRHVVANATTGDEDHTEKAYSLGRPTSLGRVGPRTTALPKRGSTCRSQPPEPHARCEWHQPMREHLSEPRRKGTSRQLAG